MSLFNLMTNLEYDAMQKKNQIINNNINNSKLLNYKYYTNNANLTPQLITGFKYKTKSAFNFPPNIQTEQDQEGLNIAFLDNYYGYRDLGGEQLTTYQNLNKNKTKTPKNRIAELLFD
jgi:hypothetical protein